VPNVWRRIKIEFQFLIFSEAENMEKSKRWKMLKTRQQLLDLLEESKWDLIAERYYEASQKIDKIKTVADQLMVEVLMNMVDACPGSK
jgi:hypothetical protein